MAKSYRSNIGLLLIRIAVSIMLLVHGIQKLDILFSSEIQFSDPIGLGSTTTLILVLIAEIICPILIIIGFKTRLAAIPPIILMLVAVFIVKAGTPFEVREVALLFLVSFITIGLLGPGRLSIDKS
jgi:putative oxidoreductase